MSDFNFQKAHEEEIQAEFDEDFRKRFPRKTLAALESIDNQLYHLSHAPGHHEALDGIKEHLAYILMRAKSIDGHLASLRSCLYCVIALLVFIAFK
jgi:hypothetical protein